MDIRERFDKFVIPVPEISCLIFTGQWDKNGYGKFKLRDGTQMRAHRMAWILANGPIPPAVEVLHSCDLPPCVNTDHLRLGTNAENMHDKAVRLRVAGARHPQARLTEAQVLEIRAVAGTKTLAELATRYGVAVSTIDAVIQRQNWRHV